MGGVTDHDRVARSGGVENFGGFKQTARGIHRFFVKKVFRPVGDNAWAGDQKRIQVFLVSQRPGIVKNIADKIKAGVWPDSAYNAD
jgi:hypothetical protein